MEHDILGHVIKQFRIHKGLSQEQLAEILNCSTRHIMAIENEGHKPGYNLLYRIIRILNIPADMIFYPEQNAVSTKKQLLISKLNNMLHMCDENTTKIILAAVQEAINLR